ncbi:VIT1/CCC1 transporter family protein [Candidatus Woesearchaeota archaeon]|nr:VIT1/CCC1 transporter family protein [Candidatus Woesearchaeota archaeon]
MMRNNLRAIRDSFPSEIMSNIILGGQDGLVNTFGVILGVAAASGDIRVVIAGGLAACFAESISMGAVAYTSQRAKHDHYLAQLEKAESGISKSPAKKKAEVKEIYKGKGFVGKELEKITSLITSNRKAWLSTLTTDGAKVAPISRRDVNINSIIVFFSALLGSLVPIIPFFFLALKEGIYLSFILSSLTLFLLGFYKGKLTTGKPGRNGLEMLLIGLSAAILGYAIGYVFSAKV